MPIRSVLGVLGLMAFQLWGPLWAQTAPDRAGSSRPDGQYTLFAELHRPYEGNRARLQKMLRGEGYESHAEREGEIALVLTAEQIKTLFQAWIEFRKVGASASDRVITAPYLEGARIPGRFGKLIRRVYFDPQR
jgi:hypothetical protein